MRRRVAKGPIVLMVLATAVMVALVMVAVFTPSKKNSAYNYGNLNLQAPGCEVIGPDGRSLIGPDGKSFREDLRAGVDKMLIPKGTQITSDCFMVTN